MSDFYKNLQLVASEVLKEFKQGDIKLVQYETVEQLDENGVIIESTPDNPAPVEEVLTDLDGTVKGVSWKYVDNSFILKTDLEVTVSVKENVTVTKNDYFEIDGERYKIIENLTTPAAGIAVVWKFVVRKGG